MNERLNENGCGNALAVLEKEKESPFAQLQIRDRPADRPSHLIDVQGRP